MNGATTPIRKRFANEAMMSPGMIRTPAGLGGR
jgi:hypothetical protein